MPVSTLRIKVAALLAGFAAALLLAGPADAKKRKSARKPPPAATEAAKSKPETPPLAAEETPRPEPTPIILDVAANKSLFAPGDPLVFFVHAGRPCNLTLVNIDGDGGATVLFPNDFEPDNAIAANDVRTIPGAAMAYKLRLEKPGIETVLAICTEKARRPLGILHDWERQRFTVLGDWAQFSSDRAGQEKEMQRKFAEERHLRPRRRKDAPPAIDPPPAPGEAEGRSLLILPVEDPVNPSTARAP